MRLYSHPADVGGRITGSGRRGSCDWPKEKCFTPLTSIFFQVEKVITECRRHLCDGAGGERAVFRYCRKIDTEESGGESDGRSRMGGGASARKQRGD